MNVTSSRLGAVTKDLWAKWQYTRESWTDTKSREFERKYLQELLAGVEKAVTVMDQMDKLMAKVKSDCE